MGDWCDMLPTDATFAHQPTHQYRNQCLPAWGVGEARTIPHALTLSFYRKPILIASEIRVGGYRLYSLLFPHNLPIPDRRPGMKIWEVCCYMGYRLSACTDGGFIGDPQLRPWANDPLGRTCLMVLYMFYCVRTNISRSRCSSPALC